MKVKANLKMFGVCSKNDTFSLERETEMWVIKYQLSAAYSETKPSLYPSFGDDLRGNVADDPSALHTSH